MKETQGQRKGADSLYFLHIPKTAGTSLSIFLGSHFGYREICGFGEMARIAADEDKPSADRRFFSGHHGADLLARLPKGTKTISWLREPASRLYSSYRYLRDLPKEVEVTIAGSSALFQLEQAKKLSFKEWLELPSNDAYQNNLMCNSLWPSTTWERPRLPAAKDFLFNIETFGLVERMQDSIDLLCYRFCWFPTLFGVRLNTTRKPAQGEVSQARPLIHVTNNDDVILYKFAINLFQQRWERMLTDFGFATPPPQTDASLSPADIEKRIISVYKDNVNFRSRLHRKLRERCLASHAPSIQRTEAQIQAEDAFCGSGWEQPVASIEKSGAIVRWTNSVLSEVLLGQVPKGHYKLEVRIVTWMNVEVVDSLEILFNTVPARHTWRDDPTPEEPYARVCSAVISEHFFDAEECPAVIGFRCRRIFPEPTPSQEHNGALHLGFCLDWIQLAAK